MIEDDRARCRSVVIFVCFLIATVTAVVRAQTPPDSSEWKPEIANGYLPYHQLTVDDFPIKDDVHPKAVFWVKSFIYPHYLFSMKFHNGFAWAYITKWEVQSGFDRNESSRKSSFHEMKAALPYAQGLLDINELHAREFAALKEGELPTGKGATFDAARRDLEQKVKAFCDAKFRKIEAECEAFEKETNYGENKKKLREGIAKLHERMKRAGINPAAPSP